MTVLIKQDYTRLILAAAAVVVLYGCQQQGFSEVTEPPQVTTLPASIIASTSCTLNAEINPNGFTTTGWFEWGVDTAYGRTTEQSSLGDGAQVSPLSQTITGLDANTTYIFRAVADNQGRTVFGEGRECTTLNPDTDKDGLSDGDEIAVYHTSQTESDTDKDGLSDGDEVNRRHTDPLKVDTDGDGLGDGDEVNGHHTDPLKVDTEGDGLGDGDEVNRYHTDPLKVDTDGDGLGDGDEINRYHTDPLKVDTEGDGLGDGDEVNRHHTDPLKADTDGDGLGDGDEIIRYATDPLRVDTDGDASPDGLELSVGSNPLDPNSTPADLTMTLISGPGTAALGQSVTISSTVKNRGGISTGRFTVDIYLSSNNIIPDGDDIYLGSYTLNSLPTGQANSDNTAFMIPVAVPAGNYRIGAVVDALSEIVESDEGNNGIITGEFIAISEGLDSGDKSDGALSLTGVTFNLLADSSDALGNGGDGNPGQPDGFSTRLTANVSAGTTRLPVASTAGLVSGDEVLIIQVSHATNHGAYEFVKNITVADGATLLLGTGLANNYFVANAVTDRVQVVRVPHYATVSVGAGATLTTGPYNHTAGIGGVVAMRAATIIVDGTVSVASLGFAGGAPVTLSASTGLQGFSYAGTSPLYSLIRNLGGGAGGRYSSTFGGGGGGYATSGANGRYSGGGETYGSADLARLYLGSGGGSGGTLSCGVCASAAGAGGAGGGIIYIAADTIAGAGALSAAGGRGDDYLASQSGPGGGGSGGSIRAQAATWSMAINVAGGAGGVGARLDGLDNAGGGGSGRSSVSIGAPDLIISDVASPLTAARGDTIGVSSTVRNQQLGAATAPFRVGIYASLDPVITADDAFLGDYPLSGISGNSAATTAVNVPIPPDLYLDPPAGYQYRKNIAIHPANGTGSGVLRDFPVLIDITDPGLRTTANGGRVQSMVGYDITFTDALGVTLNYELEQYDPTTGHIRVWVRVKELAGGSADTNIYLYYGNGAVMATQADIPGTWSGNYKAVFHQDETPGLSAQMDSTINGNNAANINLAGPQNVVDAVIGKGISFDGVNDYERTQANLLDTGAGDWTLETWMKIDALNADGANIVQSEDNPVGQRLLFVDPNDGKLYSEAGGQAYGPGQTISPGAWYHVVLVHDHINEKSKWYVNGAWLATSSNVHIASNNGRWRFGLGSNGGGALAGVLDEIRISDIQRSPEWIKAEYTNMASPSASYSVGAEENAASFASQYPFYVGAIADYTDAVVELNGFNNAGVSRDSSGAPAVMFISQ